MSSQSYLTFSCCSADCASQVRFTIVIVVSLVTVTYPLLTRDIIYLQVTVNGQHHCASAVTDEFNTNLADSMVKKDSADMSGCAECNDTLSTCPRCDPLLLV